MINAAAAAATRVNKEVQAAGKIKKKEAPRSLRDAWDAFITAMRDAYKVFGDIGPMKKFGPIEITFRKGSEFKGQWKANYVKECGKQLAQQEQAINAIKCGEWASNRTKFTAVGRSTSDDAYIKEYRELLRTSVADMYADFLRKNVGKPKGKERMTYEALGKEYADMYVKSHAILHIPDQVAGGRLLFPDGKPTKVNMFEIKVRLAGINGEIGQEWGRKGSELAKLDAAVAKADVLSLMSVTLKPAFS